jgi:uncharacterized membrane protein YphA (DoxX/SURF4 family)
MATEHGTHPPRLNWCDDREAQRCEGHLLAVALAVAVIAKGSGALSLDRLLFITMGA